jgi:hypothetical protein
MRNVVRFALGLSVIAVGLAVATPASARSGRWVNFVNKDRPVEQGGPFFLGVAGGCTVRAPGEPCSLGLGARIIVWANVNDGKNHDDQKWITLDSGSGFFTNFLPVRTAVLQQAVLGIEGPSDRVKREGQPVIISDAIPGNPNPTHTWAVVRAEDFGATTFAGCFVFVNINSGQVAGVAAANVFSGANVIQWPLFPGMPNQAAGWHPDQFWCPVQ